MSLARLVLRSCYSNIQLKKNFSGHQFAQSSSYMSSRKLHNTVQRFFWVKTKADHVDIVNKNGDNEHSRSEVTSVQLPKNVDSKLFLQFTCKKCTRRMQRWISKQAYRKGTVLVRCDGCQGLHLIADNLDIFKLGVRNIEEILAKKGEHVTKEGKTIEELMESGHLIVHDAELKNN